MSETTSTNPSGGTAGPLPVNDVPGLSDLILYLDNLLSDDQAIEVHKLLADIFGTADATPLSSLSDPPDTSAAAAMDAARTGRIGRAHAKMTTARAKLEARYPGMPKLSR